MLASLSAEGSHMDISQTWPSDDWFELLAAGDAETVEQFWNDFGEPLRRVAERQLSKSLAKRVDPEDIVQSACRTFFRRAQEGQFDCTNQDDLWRLMLTITLNKARMQARYHARAKRAMSAENSLDDVPEISPHHVEDAIEAVDFADLLETIFQHLDSESHQVLERLLADESQSEIASALGCSERTVRRIKSRIRDGLTLELKSQLEN